VRHDAVRAEREVSIWPVFIQPARILPISGRSFPERDLRIAGKRDPVERPRFVEDHTLGSNARSLKVRLRISKWP
jgi:hypothetical protein